MDYQDFLNNKTFVLESKGFDVEKEDLNPMLFSFQLDIVRWALAKGRAAGEKTKTNGISVRFNLK